MTANAKPLQKPAARSGAGTAASTKSWIRIGPVGLQPAEMAKIATALMLARVLGEWREPPKTLWALWKPQATDYVTRALNPSTAPMRLDLPCGRYYLSGINSNAAVTIVAHGHTALFIEGDVIANNPLTITVTPEAQLDIFVAGNLTTNNEFKLGSPNYPALLRVYIGGDVGFTTNNPVTLAGYLYAVPGSVTANNEVEVYGGLYSNGITTNNAWNIHYDRRITTIGDSCRGSGGGSGGSNNGTNNGSNNGTNNGSNGGSNNGSSTDICTTQGDACSTSSECCSPLSCEGGVCSLLDCVPSNGACSSNSDCCRGLCSSTTDGICIIQ